MVEAKTSGQRRKIALAYGRGSVPFIADSDIADWCVLKPKFAQPLRNAHERFRAACRNPIGAAPLRDLVKASDRVVIVTSDGTRAVPNQLLIPWLLQELPVSPEQVTVLLGNGSHRPNTPAEIETMFGRDLATMLKVLNHDAYDAGHSEYVGKSVSGGEAFLDKAYVEADRRIALGFIEPHFFAGFSGGAKGIIPGVASIETIKYIHSAALIGHPLSTWGIVQDNPIRAEIEQMVAHCPPDLIVNVTLNSDKQITALFLGDYIEAHRAGCVRSREEAMVAVPHDYDMVITSNSGYPLDQNLYQAVKGMSAAARIVKPGGTILVASECSDGVPDHGNFADLMRVGAAADDILANVYRQEKVIVDQWQAQAAAEIMKKAEVLVFSAMDGAAIAQCKLGVVNDLQAEIEARIHAFGGRPQVAVLPDGPLTIPYLQDSN